MPQNTPPTRDLVNEILTETMRRVRNKLELSADDFSTLEQLMRNQPAKRAKDLKSVLSASESGS